MGVFKRVSLKKPMHTPVATSSRVFWRCFAVSEHLMNALIQLLGGSYGIVNTDGKLWRNQRRFALQVFKHFGMGNNLMQEKILDEVRELLNGLDGSHGVEEAICIADRFDVCVGSVISALLFGFRYDKVSG